MKYKQHDSKKEMKILGFFYLVFTVIGFAGSVILFYQNDLMNGLIFISIMIMMGIFTKQQDDDLDKRRMEEFICKVNGKNWEDFCNCEKCKAQQSLDSVREK